MKAENHYYIIGNQQYPGTAKRFFNMMMSGRFALWKWVAMPDHWAIIGYGYREVYRGGE